MRRNAGHRWAVVLAAGEGVRLSDFIRERTGRNIPKQYSTFTGTRCLLRHTLDRVERSVDRSRVVTVIASGHEGLSRRTLTEEEAKGCLITPRNSETGSNVLRAALCVRKSDPDAVVLLAPSDHFVLEEEHYLTYVDAAFHFVDAYPAFVVLLGVRMREADPEYGWIELAQDFLVHEGNRFCRVTRFREKPSLRTNTSLIRKGAVVNSMITVAAIPALLRMYHHAVPEIYRQAVHRKIGDKHAPADFDESVLASIPPFNFSREVLQQNPDRLRVLCMEGVYWSDWGKKDRILRDLSLLQGG